MIALYSTRQPRGGASIVGSSASVNAAPVAADRASDVVTEEERTLYKLFSEVFDVEEVAPDDDFFALGGHSLLAMSFEIESGLDCGSMCLFAPSPMHEPFDT